MGIRKGSKMLARRIEPVSIDRLKRISDKLHVSEARALDVIIALAGRHIPELRDRLKKKRK